MLAVVSGERIVVLGAQGVLGASCSRALRKSGFDVVRLGRRPEPGDDFRQVDLADYDALAQACDGARLVLQTVPDTSFRAERMVLERGGTLLGIASLPLAQSSTLEAGEDAIGAVVIDAGLNPGVTTLVLADMLGRHPDADGIDFGYTSRLSPRTSAGRSGFQFFFEQLASAPRRPTAEIPFPAPFGPRNCIEFSHGEEGWLGTFARDHTTRLYVYFAPPVGHALLLALNRLGMLGVLRARLLRLGRKRIPTKLSKEPKCDWIALRRRSERLEAWTIEGRGDYAMTVTSAVAFVKAILDRSLEPGVHRAQDVFSLADIRSHCESAGIRFVEQPV
jgi:NAD(P)-dependent dehydrogenase (short-subunit alcohol dehydrogenase family)